MAVFYNQATLSYGNNVTNSNIVTGELLEVLSVTKTSLGNEYSAENDVVYVVSIVNSGATALTGVTVTDDLGTFPFGAGTLTPLDYVNGSVVLYVDGVLQPTPAVTAGPPLVISGLTVPAGGTALLLYRALPNSFAPLAVGSTITNTATVTGGGLSTSLTASHTITANEAPRLTISKSMCPTTVVENGLLTYTFVIENLGNIAAAATDNLTVTDTFSPILSGLSVTLDGVALAEPADYTYNTATGEFATVPGRITVPAATYTTDPVTGVVTVTPGVAVLRVSGTV